jgi:hypothetical protein
MKMTVAASSWRALRPQRTTPRRLIKPKSRFPTFIAEYGQCRPEGRRYAPNVSPLSSRATNQSRFRSDAALRRANCDYFCAARFAAI